MSHVATLAVIYANRNHKSPDIQDFLQAIRFPHNFTLETNIIFHSDKQKYNSIEILRYIENLNQLYYYFPECFTPDIISSNLKDYITNFYHNFFKNNRQITINFIDIFHYFLWLNQYSLYIPLLILILSPILGIMSLIFNYEINMSIYILFFTSLIIIIGKMIIIATTPMSIFAYQSVLDEKIPFDDIALLTMPYCDEIFKINANTPDFLDFNPFSEYNQNYIPLRQKINSLIKQNPQLKWDKTTISNMNELEILYVQLKQVIRNKKLKRYYS